MKAVQGVMHGRSIELTEDLGLSDGQPVRVVVMPVGPPAGWGEGVRRSAGAWADADGIDAVFDRITAERKRDRRPQ